MSRSSNRSDEPVYPIGSVGKALELLGLFRHPSRAVRIGEASDALDIAPSTVHRMFSMFQKYGFVRQHAATKAYLPGAALLELARALVEEPNIGDAAMPELERLVERTKETAYLSVLQDDFVQLVVCVESPLPLKAGSEVGRQFRARSSASGRAMLAHLSDGEVRKLFPSERGLKAALDEVRRRGYAVRVRNADGIHALACAVTLPAGNPPAAVVLAVPSGRMEIKRALLVRELRRSATRLTAVFSKSP